MLNDFVALERELQNKSPFRFKFKDDLKFFNCPESILQRNHIAQLMISNAIESTKSTMLLGEEDYDPDDESKSSFQKLFPPILKDRILEITKLSVI